MPSTMPFSAYDVVYLRTELIDRQIKIFRTFNSLGPDRGRIESDVKQLQYLSEALEVFSVPLPEHIALTEVQAIFLRKVIIDHRLDRLEVSLVECRSNKQVLDPLVIEDIEIEISYLQKLKNVVRSHRVEEALPTIGNHDI